MELRCTGPARTLLTWGAYAVAVTLVSEYLAARGFPPAAGWFAGLGMAFAVLVWTRET
jgi:hypothetical protein